MRKLLMLVAALALPITAPAAAQVQTVDPNTALGAEPSYAPSQPQQSTPDTSNSPDYSYPDQSAPSPSDQTPYDTSQVPPATSQRDPLPPPSSDQQYPDPASNAARQGRGDTYQREDLIGAAEGVFGRGAEGLAGLLENILRDQGEPNAYIAGREASGAFVVGLRYGSGRLFHKVEGQRDVYWTGPSVGFDVGGDANKVFVLVYNLYDSQDLYKRFPAGEGRAYFVGGFSATYLRRGNVVLIPVRLGVGWRLGVNAGYMRFTEKSTWIPF